MKNRNYIVRILPILLFANLFFSRAAFSQNAKHKSTATTAKNVAQKMPQKYFFQLIDSIAAFELNDATAFKHADLQKKYHNTFLSYIKDSVATETVGISSLAYYRITLKNGTVWNGDIYWNDKKSYIIFTLDGKKYVNTFTRDGVSQIKSIFKL
ncbi:MAG TPA: hypothetical protein PLK15_06480 [Chitinophagales bacterium]|jgi:hypothetical protein|nr:hypothetical protein [Chitinophagales bacterium]